MNRTWSVVAGLLLVASAVLVVGAAMDWWSLSFQVGSRTVGDGVVSLLLAGVSSAIVLVIVLDLWETEDETSRAIFAERSTTRLDDNTKPATLVRPTATSPNRRLDWPAALDSLGADVSKPFGHPPEEVTPVEMQPAPDTPAEINEPVRAFPGFTPPVSAPAPAPTEPRVATSEPKVEPRLVVDLCDGPAPAHLLLEGGAGVIDLSSYGDEEILSSIAAGEAQVVDLLLDEGYLTTEGALTDDDTAALVFVSVTTSELIGVLTGRGYLADDGQITGRLDEARRFQAQPALRG